MGFTTRTLPGVKQILEKIQQTLQNAVVPVGTILAYHGSVANIPSGWKICNGTDGTPDLTGRYLCGNPNGSGAYKEAGLPNISGNVGPIDTASVQSGAFYKSYNVYGCQARDSWYTKQTIQFNASRCSKIYGKSNTVTPSTFEVIFIIKVS